MDNTLRWLWRVPGRNKGYVLALTLIQAVAGGLGVLYALLLRSVVDSAVARDAENLRRYALLMLALVILQLGISALLRWLRELAKTKFENLFKMRLTENLLRKEYSAVSATHTGEWLNRLTNDTVVVANGYVEILPGLTGTVVRMTSAVIMILALEPWFGYILFPGGALLVLFTYLFRKVLKRMHKAIQESDGRLRIFLQERLSSLMVIKTFAAETQTAAEAAEKMADHKAARMRRNAFSNFCNFGFGAAMQGMYLVGVVYCATGIMTGHISYGTLTAIMQLIGQVQGPFASISGYLPRWYAMTASADRLMESEAFADDGRVAEASVARAYYEHSFAALGLRRADFSYRSEEAPVVLKGLSLEIRKGETVAFTGHSGCGKSTVLKLLMCLYPLDGGERWLDGQPLDASWRRLFAYVPQGNVLMSGSIRDVVSFAVPEERGNDEKLRQALKIACADAFVDDLDHMLGESGSGLSEGQMQRIAVARAIFSEAPILLLDEATSALDEQTEKQLLENLRSLTDKTVVIVTHRRAALSICDRVLRFTENGVEEQV